MHKKRECVQQLARTVLRTGTALHALFRSAVPTTLTIKRQLPEINQVYNQARISAQQLSANQHLSLHRILPFVFMLRLQSLLVYERNMHSFGHKRIMSHPQQALMKPYIQE